MARRCASGVERQLGYKMAKYVMRIELVESFAHIGGGNGGYWEDRATNGMPGSEAPQCGLPPGLCLGVAGREVLVRAWNILGLLDLAVAASEVLV